MGDKWEKYYRHVAGHIPYAVCKAKGVSPLAGGMDDEDEQDFEMGGIGFESFDDSQSESPLMVTRKPLPVSQTGGRPLDGECNHNQDENLKAY